jgi:hypothetical protein
MNLGLAVSLRSARLGLVAVALDAAATPGLVRLYSGTQPATGASITSQVLQCSVPLNDPCATLAGTVLTFPSATADGVRVAADTITWARFVDGDGNFVLDGDVTVSGGGGFVTVSAVTGAIGALLRFFGGSLSE